MKRIMLLLIALVLIVSITTGTSWASSKIQVLHSWASPPNPEGLEVIFSRFEKLNPNYRVHDNPVQFEAYTQLIKIVMPSNTPPDVIVHKPGSNTRAQIDAGMFLDLTNFWTEKKLDAMFPKYAKELWTRHDRIWGIPFKGQVYMVWYRPSIFKKVGVKPPKTWKELLTACSTLKAAGYVPINASDKNPWSATHWVEMILLGTAGQDFYNDLMLGRASWTDPRVIKAFETWKELLDAGYVMPNPNAYSFQEGSLHFGQGKAAIYYSGTFMPARLWSAMPDVDINYFLFPTIDPSVERTLHIQADGWAVPRKARNVEGAKALLAYMASAEAQENFAKIVGEPVLNKNVSPKVYPHADVLGAATLERFKYQGVNPLDLALEPTVATEVQIMTQMFDDNRDMAFLKKELARIDKIANKIFSEIKAEVAKGFWK